MRAISRSPPSRARTRSWRRRAGCSTEKRGDHARGDHAQDGRRDGGGDSRLLAQARGRPGRGRGRLAEIETDKATMELEADDAGVLTRLIAGEGDEVAVGEAIAVISADGEAPDAAPDE